MVACEVKDMSIEITWEDTVIVAQDALAEFHPGRGGSVCGMSDQPADLEGEDESVVIARLYLVEFSDGEAIEIPGKYLSKENE